MFTVKLKRFAHVAPARNVSIVLALVKADIVNRKTIVEITMVIIRDVVLLKELQTSTGASNRKIIMVNISVRAIRPIKEPEKI